MAASHADVSETLKDTHFFLLMSVKMVFKTLPGQVIVECRLVDKRRLPYVQMSRESASEH